MMYWTCPQCGANLDPGERCDCRDPPPGGGHHPLHPRPAGFPPSLGIFSRGKGRSMESRNMAPPGAETGLNRGRSQRNPAEQPAGQQAVNAALAALAKTGDAFALGQLWQINRGLLRSLFWRWYPAHKALADAHGMAADDFEQEGYFAVQYAAQTYDPAQGSFAGWLWQAMKRQIQQALTNGHRRNIIGPDGKNHTISADPLNHCTSLDLPVGEDEDGATLGMMQPDPAAAADLLDVEERIYTDELHAALEEALHKLTEREERVIRGRFYEQKTMREVAADDGTTIERVRQIEASAFRRLRGNTRLRRWHDEIITSHAWRGTGFTAWAAGGSVEERAVEYLENYLERLYGPGGEVMPNQE